MNTSKKQSGKTIWAVILLLAGNLIFFLTIWLSQKYDHVSLDQFIYQMRTSAAGANRSLMNSAYVRVGVYGCVLTLAEVVVAGILFGVLSHPLKAIFKADKYYRMIIDCKVLKFLHKHVLPICLAVFIVACSFFVVQMNFIEYLSNIFSNSTFIEDNYADPNTVNMTFPEEKRNLIYIFLESLENTFADTEAGGPVYENFMPELSELAENNVNFSHDDGLGGALTYAGSTWTAGAMVTQTSGMVVQMPLLAKNYGGNHSYIPGLVSIGEILEDAGYSNTLLVGSNADFANRKDYFEEHGNYNIIDTESLKAEGRLDEDYRVWWGFEDEKLFGYAREELTRLASQDQPFNFTMLTCDTHFPSGYVCRLCDDEYSRQYSNVVRCSSKQVVAFIQWIQEQPFYENTTIVLCGDHLTMDPKFMKTVDENYERTIYNCIINPVSQPVKEKNRLFGTMDMFPTTLGALGVEMEGNRLGLGTNLFSETETLTEEFGYAYVNKELQKNSKFYNKELLGM